MAKEKIENEAEAAKPAADPIPATALDVIREMRAEFQQRDAAREAELARMREQHDQLQRTLTEVLSRPAAAPVADPRDAEAIKPKNYIEKLRASLDEHYAMRNKAEAELADGPKQFVVSMAGEPRMTRQVGAHSKAEADGKWRQYFGVTGADSKKVITVEEMPAGTPPVVNEVAAPGV